MNNNKKLPSTWQWVRLGEILLDLSNGTAAKQNDQGLGFPVTRIETIQKSAFDMKRIKSVQLDENEISRFRYQLDDIALSHINSYKHVGKTAIFKGNPEILIHGMNLLRLRFPKQYVNPDYIFWFMQSHDFREAVRSKIRRAVNQVSINQRNLRGINIPLAPFREQNFIVSKIESLIKKNNRVKQSIENIPLLTKKMRQSILEMAFSGKLTYQSLHDEPVEKILDTIETEHHDQWENNLILKGKNSRKYKYSKPKKHEIIQQYEIPENWVWTDIGNIAFFIGSGITPRGGKKNYVKKGIPFIRSQNVYPDGLHIENVAFVTPEMHSKMIRTHVKTNDVLLNITGASIGRSTFVPENFGPANVNQHVCIIRSHEKILPKYLSYFLNSPKGQNQIFSAQTGVTREGLNYSQIKAISVPLSPFNEQKRIVLKIDKLFSKINEIDTISEKVNVYADSIQSSLLKKAFRGELVPQNLNDEPVQSLLKTIRLFVKTNKKRKKIKKKSFQDLDSKDSMQQKPLTEIINEFGMEATVEDVFLASRLTINEFWDELKLQIETGSIEKIQKNNLILLRTK